MIKILENPNPDTIQYKAVCPTCQCKFTCGNGDIVFIPCFFGSPLVGVYCPNCGSTVLRVSLQTVKAENYKINENGNVTTCAVILKNEQGEILGCHPTSHPKGIHLSLPKGCADEGEIDAEAAVRECREETGYYIPKQYLEDLGLFSYIKGKDIHLFVFTKCVNWHASEFWCESTFEQNGKQIPEVDAYYWVKPDEWHLFSKGIQEVLTKVRDKIIS